GEMLLLSRVGMSGEMLPRCDHAVLLKTVHECRAERRIDARILAERTNPDHRVRWIVVDVEDGREREMNAERATFHRGNATLLVGEGCVACRADSHLRGEDRRSAEIDGVRQKVATARSITGAEFEIRTDEQ